MSVTTARPTTFVGIQISPISFVDEGVDAVLDTLQRRIGVNVLMIGTISWLGLKVGRRISHALEGFPDHGIAAPYAMKGGAYIRVRDSYYARTAIRGFRSPDPELGDRDILDMVIPAARARGMRIMPEFMEPLFKYAGHGATADVEVEGLKAGYGPAEVLFGVSLALRRGEVAALLGRNGAGKSTTLKAIMGLLPARAGRVRFAGADITGLAPFRIARMGLGYVPEERRIFTDLTVFENLEVGRRAAPAGRAAWTPERASEACGVPAEQLRRAARRFATARAALTLWGMGVSQSVHGTDNARALISLALVSGQVGRPGAGLHPLRGQNNVQGASDAGLIPMMLPDYHRTDDDAARGALEALWGAPLPPAPGLTVVETLRAAERGDIRGMLIMGENPAMSDPDLTHARAALARLQHLVVQDIFLTETAALADVVLPASAWPEKDGTVTNTNRQVQRGRAALDPPGEARRDLDILVALARGLGLDWRYAGPAEVYAEMAAAMPSLANITWDRLERENSVTTPCHAPDQPGEEILFADGFHMPGGRARLVPAGPSDPEEATDAEFPLVLTTGRQLEHWHTGAMTRHASVLAALRPSPEVTASPETLRRAGLGDGDRARITTRRGAVECAARADPSLPDGLLFLPFAYREAAANVLTDARLDPVGRIPGFKFSAARIERAG